MMTTEPKLSVRLSAAASMCGGGSVADIGTDHALLPIKLVLDGHKSALASDIREGPCERARANVEKYKLSEKIRVVCRPGLEKIDEFSPDNIFICGMGGEMIASILEESDYPEKSRCRLILQPQSMQDVLRKYLCANGFSIDEERVVFDSGKYYQLIRAEFDGEKRSLSETEYRLGKLNLGRARESLSETDRGWLEFVLSAAKKRVTERKNSRGISEDLADNELILTIENIFEGK